MKAFDKGKKKEHHTSGIAATPTDLAEETAQYACATADPFLFPTRMRYSEAYLLEHLLADRDIPPMTDYGWPAGPLQTLAAVFISSDADAAERHMRALLSQGFSKELACALWRCDESRVLLLAQPKHPLPDEQWKTAAVYLGIYLRAVQDGNCRAAGSGICRSLRELQETCRQLMSLPLSAGSLPLSLFINEDWFSEQDRFLINTLRRHISEGKTGHLAKALRSAWKRGRAGGKNTLWHIMLSLAAALPEKENLDAIGPALRQMLLKERENDGALFERWTGQICGCLAARRPDDSERMISQILRAMRDGFASDLSQAQLARRFGMDPAYFSRYFKSQTGRRYIDVMTDIRMEHALDILAENPACTLEQLAQACHYYSKTHFCEVFRKYTGKTVSEYLREAK